jgi:hypothetical protein
MEVIEALRTPILEPHEHLHINHVRALGRSVHATQITRFGRNASGQVGGQAVDHIGGYRALPVAWSSPPVAERRSRTAHEAQIWAENEFPGALVEKVGNCVPKQGYDVRVTPADGSEIHIEAKYTEDGSVVMLSEGERYHNQDSGVQPRARALRGYWSSSH